MLTGRTIPRLIWTVWPKLVKSWLLIVLELHSMHGLAWIGWIGLEWIERDWNTLEWVGSDQKGSKPTVKDWSGLEWIGIALGGGRIEEDWRGLEWIQSPGGGDRSLPPVVLCYPSKCSRLTRPNLQIANWFSVNSQMSSPSRLPSRLPSRPLGSRLQNPPTATCPSVGFNSKQRFLTLCFNQQKQFELNH